MDQWGFNCSCSACSAPAQEISASDTRIARIEALQSQLTDLSPTRNASIATAEELVSLYEEESLSAPIAEAYYYAALECSYSGDLGCVKKWARKAAEVGRLWRGPDHADTRRWEALLADPEAHETWLYKLEE